MTIMALEHVAPALSMDALRSSTRVPCQWPVRARRAFGGAAQRYRTTDVSPDGLQLEGTPAWNVGEWLVLHVETPHGTAGVEARLVRVCDRTRTWAVRFDGLDRSGVRLLTDLLTRDGW